MDNTAPYIYVPPRDKEVMELVIKAACEHFYIEEEILISNTSIAIANIRYLVCFLIINNTGLKDYVIAKRVGKCRSTINTGIEKIDIHRRIYRQTLDDLEAVVNIANSFEKKFVWQLRLQ